MEHDQWAGYGHEDVLQDVVRHLLTTEDLDQLCDDADIPTLVDPDGQPVTITAAHTYHDAGVLTLDHGVLLELSDGSQLGLTVRASRRPHGPATLRPPGTHQPPPPRRTPGPHPPAEPSGCACTSADTCDGCGHAGCARR